MGEIWVLRPFSKKTYIENKLTIKALKYWGRMEFLISASQALNSIFLRLKTDFKLIQEFNTKNLKKLYKISQGIVLKENWSCRYSLANLRI